jgi:hypothetical protein
MATAIAPANVPSRTNAQEIAYQMANQPFALDITRRVNFINWDGSIGTALIRNFAIVGA